MKRGEQSRYYISIYIFILSKILVSESSFNIIRALGIRYYIGIAILVSVLGGIA
jgi:hypothetical protein